jgi:hypothetical protein
MHLIASLHLLQFSLSFSVSPFCLLLHPSMHLWFFMVRESLETFC